MRMMGARSAWASVAILCHAEENRCGQSEIRGRILSLMTVFAQSETAPVASLRPGPSIASSSGAVSKMTAPPRVSGIEGGHEPGDIAVIGITPSGPE